MDGSQVTGAASSYARKYALQGLFAIDDTKDADALPPEQPRQQSRPNTPDPNKNAPQSQQTALSDKQLGRLYAIAASKGKTKETVVAEVLKNFKVAPEQMSKANYDATVKHYESLADKEA